MKSKPCWKGSSSNRAGRAAVVLASLFLATFEELPMIAVESRRPVQVVKYSPKLDIREADQLPAGLGCNFLLCEWSSENGIETFWAKSWRRVRPTAELKADRSLVLVTWRN